MGLFSRKPKLPKVVSVKFRDLAFSGELEADHSYAYRWELREQPFVGMRVWVPGMSGLSTAVVVALENVGGYPATKAVRRVATREECDAAVAKASRAESDWLEMARKAAGLQSSTRKRKVPEGYPEIAPVDGDASPSVAGEYGSMWWRAKKLAEARGLPADEVKAISSIAHRWYAIRDRG